MNQNFFNLSHRKKRDLLSDLLIGKDREGIISKKELIALKRIIADSASSTPPHPALSIAVAKRATKISEKEKKQDNKKKKTTFYLSPEISTNLATVEKKIQTSGKGKQLSRISRSHIVDRTLSLVLDDFVAKGEKSWLMQVILQEC